MLPSSERLTRAGLFARAYNERKSISGALVTLYVVPRSDRHDRHDRHSKGHRKSSDPVSNRSSNQIADQASNQASNQAFNQPSSQPPNQASELPRSIDSQALSQIPKECALNGASLQVVARMPSARMPLAGFVIAKKVCKSACRRNRAKRRVREAYRLFSGDKEKSALPFLEQWYALVFVLHDKVLTASWDDIQRAVTESLNQADKKYGRKGRA